MALLTKLGLTPTPTVAKAIAAKAAADALAPPPVKSGDVPAKAPSAGAKPAVNGGDDAGARKAALAAKGEIERRHREAYAAWTKLAEAEPKVAKLIAASTGPQKAALVAKKKLLDAKIAEANKAVAQLQKDLEALDSPATSREEHVRILARSQSKDTAVGLSEIDLHQDKLDAKPGEKHETRTTTAYGKGKATVEKTEKKRTYGLDGLTVSNSKETETSFEGNTIKTGEETKTNVSLTGKVSREEKKSVEIETADGKKMQVEKTSSAEISAGGVSGTKTEKSGHRDGSSDETSVSGGVERGDGKIAAVASKSTTATDASGDAVTTGKKGKVGGIAGKDGYGALAGGEGSFKNQRKGGFNTGVVAGLDANVVCNIGDPVGKPPNVKYPLTLAVNLGGAIGVSTGHAKEGGSGKASVEAKVGKTVFMKRTYMLGEAEAKAYVESLTEAATGGAAAATHKEFAIIAAGLSRGWPFAQAMFKSGSADLKAGESSERGGSKIKSGKLAADVKVVTLEASAESSEQHGAKTTRNEDGTLDAELTGTTTDKVSGKVGIKSGVVGGSVGKAHSFTTSSGYVIKIDPKKDPNGEQQKALDACDGQADYDQFAAKYPDTVQSATRGTDESDSKTVGLSVGAVDAEIGLHNRVQKTTKTGKGGKLEQEKVVGSAGGGGSIGLGDTRIGDSVDNVADATLDGQGNANVSLTKTRKATDWTKLAKAKLPFMGDDEDKDGKKKPAKGLLATATGAKDEEDTDSHEVYGLTLSNKDLDQIAKIAGGNKRRWDKGALMDYKNSHEDWEVCRQAIVAAGGNRQVVARELSEFVGGSKSNRLDMLVRFLRPDGDVSIGARANFPDSLASLKPDYEKLVLGASEGLIEELAAKEGPQKAGVLGKEIFDTLESLLQKITAAKEVLAPAVRAEMLSAIGKRKTLVIAAMKKNAGAQSEQEEKAALEAEYRRTIKTCLEYQTAQNDIFAKFGDLWAPGRAYNNEKLIKLLQQLRDLFAVWKPDYAHCAELGKKIGYPEVNYTHWGPSLAKAEEWEKKIHQW